MTGVLEIVDVELGYCDQCGRPCVPGVFKVFNWHHRFRLCDICLQRFAADVNERGNKLMEAFRK